jgi:hypothetical protein
MKVDADEWEQDCEKEKVLLSADQLGRTKLNCAECRESVGEKSG